MGQQSITNFQGAVKTQKVNVFVKFVVVIDYIQFQNIKDPKVVAKKKGLDKTHWVI